jgi:hypothetical protein
VPSAPNNRVLTGTVSISGTVNADVKKLINFSLTQSYSGSISWEYNTTDVYKGPPESSKYNSRGFYTAIDYDLYQIKVKRYDVYDEYNGTIKTGTFSYYVNTTTYDSVKKPVNLSYSKDFLY